MRLTKIQFTAPVWPENVLLHMPDFDSNAFILLSPPPVNTKRELNH